MISAAGLGTVAEILDFEGVWTTELIETMIPVAAEIEANRIDAFYRAVVSALASVLSKQGPANFDRIMKGARQEIEKAYRRNRGLDPTEGETTADQMMNIFRKLGIPIKGEKPRKAK